MEALRSSKTSVTIYQWVCYNIPRAVNFPDWMSVTLNCISCNNVSILSLIPYFHRFPSHDNSSVFIVSSSSSTGTESESSSSYDSEDTSDESSVEGSPGTYYGGYGCCFRCGWYCRCWFYSCWCEAITLKIYVKLYIPYTSVSHIPENKILTSMHVHIFGHCQSKRKVHLYTTCYKYSIINGYVRGA